MGTLSYIYIFEPTHDSFSLSKSFDQPFFLDLVE